MRWAGSEARREKGGGREEEEEEEEAEEGVEDGEEEEGVDEEGVDEEEGGGCDSGGRGVTVRLFTSPSEEKSQMYPNSFPFAITSGSARNAGSVIRVDGFGSTSD